MFNLQILQLEKRLEQLRSDKHQLFLQLKKVLNQEEETRRRAQLKEQRYYLVLSSFTMPTCFIVTSKFLLL